MAKKKKNSMALFEVVAGGQESTRKTSLSVPDWMKRQPEDAQQDASPQPPPPSDDVSVGGEQPDGYEAVEATDQSAVQSQAVEQAVYDDVEAPAVSAEVPDVGPGETDVYEPVAPVGEAAAPVVSDVSALRPALSVVDGRVTFSLNYVSCAVAGLGVVLVLVMAFVLGRSSAPVPAANEPSGAGARAGLVVGKSPARRPSGGRPARISGKQYLVIQQLGERSPAAKVAAEAIVAYCEAVRGDRATVVDDGRQYLVLSGVAFDSDRSAAALEYAADVHALGKRFKASENDKYDFSQMDRQGRLDPWFVKEP